MTYMLKVYRTFLIAFVLWNSLFLFGCASLENRLNQERKTEVKYANDFEQGKNLTLIGQYEKAEPLLVKSVLKLDQNSHEANLYLAYVYDQISEPEKSIIYSREFLSTKKNKILILKANTLLLKNLAKVGVNIETHPVKNEVAKTINLGIYDANQLVSELGWAFNFNCHIYCVEEVKFLKEIQIQVFYLIEKDIDVADRVSDLLLSKYDLFLSSMNNSKIELKYRKKIAFSVYEALQKANSLHLEDNTASSVKTAGLVSKLSQYQTRIEQWIYDNQ